ncbi:MAG: HAMP domain-containing protein, partial [bacterium]
MNHMRRLGRFLIDHLYHYPRQKLQFKIIFFTILIVAVWMSISAYVSLVTQTGYFLEGARRRIFLLTQTIENSIVHSMLIGKHEDVRDLLINIADEMDIQEVRILSKQKTVLASADVNEVGTSLPGADLSFIDQGKMEHIEIDQDYTAISMLKPIAGKSSCYTCHNRTKEIMGILDVRISIGWMRIPLMANRVFIVLSAIMTILLIGISVYFLLFKLVAKPVHSLVEVMNIVRRGNWDARVFLDTTDELGKLGHTFNYMISEISELHERDLRREQALVRAEEELKYKRQIEDKNIQLERTIDILTTLNNIAREIGSVLDIDQLLTTVLKMTVTILDGSDGFLSIYNKEKKSLELGHTFYSGTGHGMEALDRKIAQHVFAHGKALLIPDFSRETRFHTEEHQNPLPQSVLYVPLYAKDQIVGIIGMI